MILIHKKENLSQATLLKMIGTSDDVIGRYEQEDIKLSIDVVTKFADTLEVSVDYLIGKTDLIIDKETLRRIEDISNMKEENKNFIFNLIDMVLRDMKAKKAYS